MSNMTKLYENLKNEAVCIAHWQHLWHSLIRKREKNKLGTSYKNNSSLEKVPWSVKWRQHIWLTRKQIYVQHSAASPFNLLQSNQSILWGG